MIIFGYILLAVGLLGVGDYFYQTKYNNNDATVASAWNLLGYIFKGTMLAAVGVGAIVLGFLIVRRKV